MDWEGHYCPNAAALYLSQNQLSALNAVERHEVSPAWLGHARWHRGHVRGALVLARQGSGYRGDGSFQGGRNVDLGAVYPVQITAHIVASGFSLHDSMASWTSLADLPSLAGSSPEAWGVEVDVRVSDDTPFGGAWQPISGGTFVGRHFSFRIRLTSLRGDVTPRVEDLAGALNRLNESVNHIDSAWMAGVSTLPGLVSPKQVRDAIAALATGAGQDWRDVRSYHVHDTAYLNSTGRPIAVSMAL